MELTALDLARCEPLALPGLSATAPLAAPVDQVALAFARRGCGRQDVTAAAPAAHARRWTSNPTHHPNSPPPHRRPSGT